MQQHEAIYDQNQYAEALRNELWKEKRNQILERDLHKCRNCGNVHNLQVHHRQYHKLKLSGEWQKPWAYDPRFLITFCEECHKIGHTQFTIPIKTI